MENAQEEPVSETSGAVRLPELPADVDDMASPRWARCRVPDRNILRRLSTQSFTGYPCHLHTEAIAACPIGAKGVVTADHFQCLS